MDHDADPAAVDQPPGQVSGDHHQIQPGTRRGARSGHGRDRTGQKPVEHAGDHQHDIPGQRPGIPGFALDGADVDPAALVVVYLIIGILYESYIHPLTILSPLPSAGVGALAILMLFHFDFSLIALIGIILLIGIVKKNGIMMVDFAIVAERDHQEAWPTAIVRPKEWQQILCRSPSSWGSQRDANSLMQRFESCLPQSLKHSKSGRARNAAPWG